MAKCKECGKEYEVGIKELCSENCFKINIQKRIIDASENDPSHTKKLSNTNN